MVPGGKPGIKESDTGHGLAKANAFIPVGLGENCLSMLANNHGAKIWIAFKIPSSWDLKIQFCGRE